MKYKSILLATDLSKETEKVANRAKDIAAECHGELNIIHVLEHSPVAYGGEFSIPIDANLEQSLQTQARKSLLALAKKLNVDEKHIFLETGSVKLSVIEKAKAVKADLIVVGTHGHHGFDILLGSRANAILHAAKCDVLVVRV